jgi:hypothetical protein
MFSARAPVRGKPRSRPVRQGPWASVIGPILIDSRVPGSTGVAVCSDTSINPGERIRWRVETMNDPGLSGGYRLNPPSCTRAPSSGTNATSKISPIRFGFSTLATIRRTNPNAAGCSSLMRCEKCGCARSSTRAYISSALCTAGACASTTAPSRVHTPTNWRGAMSPRHAAAMVAPSLR